VREGDYLVPMDLHQAPEVIVKATNLDSRAVASKDSKTEMESFIKDFEPFLRNRVSKYVFQVNGFQHEEMFSVAMLAFYEAIKHYNPQKGHFFSFANRVVSDRLIDYLRKACAHKNRIVPLEDEVESDEDERRLVASEEIAISKYNSDCRQELLLDEIKQFTSELSSWGITMDSLAKQSPKHKKLRETYKQVVSKIVETPDILQTIQLKRYFPIKAISEVTSLSLKSLEHARAFILASLIIKTGDYQFLADYVGDRITKA